MRFRLVDCVHLIIVSLCVSWGNRFKPIRIPEGATVSEEPVQFHPATSIRHESTLDDLATSTIKFARAHLNEEKLAQVQKPIRVLGGSQQGLQRNEAVAAPLFTPGAPKAAPKIPLDAPKSSHLARLTPVTNPLENVKNPSPSLFSKTGQIPRYKVGPYKSLLSRRRQQSVLKEDSVQTTSSESPIKPSISSIENDANLLAQKQEDVQEAQTAQVEILQRVRKPLYAPREQEDIQEAKPTQKEIRQNVRKPSYATESSSLEQDIRKVEPSPKEIQQRVRKPFYVTGSSLNKQEDVREVEHAQEKIQLKVRKPSYALESSPLEQDVIQDVKPISEEIRDRARRPFYAAESSQKLEENVLEAKLDQEQIELRARKPSYATESSQLEHDIRGIKPSQQRVRKPFYAAQSSQKLQENVLEAKPDLVEIRQKVGKPFHSSESFLPKQEESSEVQPDVTSANIQEEVKRPRNFFSNSHRQALLSRPNIVGYQDRSRSRGSQLLQNIRSRPAHVTNVASSSEVLQDNSRNIVVDEKDELAAKSVEQVHQVERPVHSSVLESTTSFQNIPKRIQKPILASSPQDLSLSDTFNDEYNEVKLVPDASRSSATPNIPSRILHRPRTNLFNAERRHRLVSENPSRVVAAASPSIQDDSRNAVEVATKSVKLVHEVENPVLEQTPYEKIPERTQKPILPKLLEDSSFLPSTLTDVNLVSEAARSITPNIPSGVQHRPRTNFFNAGGRYRLVSLNPSRGVAAPSTQDDLRNTVGGKEDKVVTKSVKLDHEVEKPVLESILNENIPERIQKPNLPKPQIYSSLPATLTDRSNQVKLDPEKPRSVPLNIPSRVHHRPRINFFNANAAGRYRLVSGNPAGGVLEASLPGRGSRLLQQSVKSKSYGSDISTVTSAGVDDERILSDALHQAHVAVTPGQVVKTTSEVVMGIIGDKMLPKTGGKLGQTGFYPKKNIRGGNIVQGKSSTNNLVKNRNKVETSVIQGFRVAGDKSNQLIFLDISTIGMDTRVTGDITLGDGTKLIPVEGLHTGSNSFSVPTQTRGAAKESEESKVANLPEKSANSLVRGNVPRKLPEGGIPRNLPFRSKLLSTTDQRPSTSSQPPIAIPSTKTTSKSLENGHPVFFSKTDNNANFNLRPISSKTKPKQPPKSSKSQSEQAQDSKLAKNAFTNFPAVSEADQASSVVPKSVVSKSSQSALDRLLSIANGLQIDPVAKQSELYKQKAENLGHSEGSAKDLKIAETPSLPKIVQQPQKTIQPDFRGFTKVDTKPQSQDSILRGTLSVEDPEEKRKDYQVGVVQDSLVPKSSSNPPIPPYPIPYPYPPLRQEHQKLPLDAHRAAILKVLQAEAKLRKLEEERLARYQAKPNQIYKSNQIDPRVLVPNVQTQATSFIQPHSLLLGQTSQHGVAAHSDQTFQYGETSQHGAAAAHIGHKSQHGAAAHIGKISQPDVAAHADQTSQSFGAAHSSQTSQHSASAHSDKTSQPNLAAPFGQTSQHVSAARPGLPIVSGTRHEALGQHLTSLGKQISAVLPGHFSLPSIQIPPGHFTLPTHQTQAAGHSTIGRQQHTHAGHVNIPSLHVPVSHSQPPVVDPSVQTPTGHFSSLHVNPGHFSLQSVPGLDVHQTQVAELLRAQEALRSLA